MIKVLWRTDVHIADKGPLSRKDNWLETTLLKLEQIRLLAEKLKVDAVIDGGDFFDEKSPRKNSHSMMNRVIELHQRYPCPVYCNVGNHDVIYGDYQYLAQQPLGVLFESGVFKRLYDEHELILTSKDDGCKVRFTGIPYHGVKYDYDRFSKLKKGDEDYLFTSCHLLATPQGGSMFGVEDVVSYGQLLNYESDIFAFGHSHADQGITDLGRKTVINVGSLTRGSLHDDELERKPKVVYCEFTKESYRLVPIEIKAAPALQVFDVESKKKQEAHRDELQNFVARMDSCLAAKVSQKDLKAFIMSLGEIDQKVRQKTLNYLNWL